MQRSAAEVQGFEFDWVGRDESGCLALFSTAGGGYAPCSFLQDTEIHAAVIRAILEQPTSTVAVKYPELPPGPKFTNTWKLAAERGLYAYDSSPNGGPYCLVAQPERAARGERYAPHFLSGFAPVACAFAFATTNVVYEEMLRRPR